MKSVTFRGREDKLELAGNLLAQYLQGVVLDVGCDKKHLSAYVTGRYLGIDVSGNPELVVNLEYGLPFADRSFDTVVAFDVLEHLEHIHQAFDELCRVAKRYVIIGLPNMYEWHFRIRFLLGMRLSGKYGLPSTPITDRHRWLFSLCDAQAFVRERGARNGFILHEEIIGYFDYKRVLPRLIGLTGRIFGGARANLFAYHYCAVLRRTEEVRP